METSKIYKQHEENKEWMSSLLFYLDEINIMRNRLEEIASKNNSKEIVADIEHFQNQIILQKDNIDTFKHAINLDNDLIDAEIKKNDVALERRSLADHSKIREDIQSFEHVFTSFKHEFNVFLSKWM